MGREAEREFVQILLSLGYVAIPTASLHNNTAGTGAPMGLNGKAKYVLPDTLAFRREDRVSLWAEVKSKTKPGFYRNGPRHEHGIDFVNYLDYMAMQDGTSIPVYIALRENTSPADDRREGPYTSSGWWFYANLIEVRQRGRRERNWPKPGGVDSKRGDGGWVWPRRIMTRLGHQFPLPGFGGPFDPVSLAKEP